MRDMHPATLDHDVLLDHVREVHTRRSGPGGQHRNKVQTAVVLLHEPTGITAEASERRSQAANRDMALDRLRLKLALEHRTPALLRPSERWRARTRGQQLTVAATHDDYPALVAEALDQLKAQSFDMPRAAAFFGVTTTQLLKLFKKAPAAWTVLNRLRAGAGLPPLK
jgi:hypothetical protein